MKSLIAPAAMSMTSTASTMAAIITPTCRTMPTAVITESSENTISSRAICTMTCPNVAPAFTFCCPSSPRASRESPGCSSTGGTGRPRGGSGRGGERVAEQAEQWPREAHDAGEGEQQQDAVTMASVRPVLRARRCSPAGSFPARIEMKMMLSMPRTISSTVRVRRAIQVSGEVSQVITKRTSSSRRRQTKTSSRT